MIKESQELASLPNAISAVGFVLAVHGASRLDTPLGLAETATGRVMDLADGYVARATGQTSEFGASLDATLDKLASFAIVASEWRKDIAPKTALAAMVAQNIVNSVATAAALKKHPDQALAPSKDGKYAMAAQNFALAAYAQAEILHDSRPRTSQVMRNLGHGAMVIGVGFFGTKATIGYIKRIQSAN